jgi:hypothetical protein
VDRFLAKLERKYGKYAIEHLTYFIVGGMAMVFVLSMARPDFIGRLTLDLDAVMRGEVWRLITYLFIPTSRSIYWILFSLYWVYIVGTNLEAEWGSLKFDVFYFVGMLGTTAAAFISGAPATNTWLNLSLFFAFATIFPNFEIYPIPFIPFTIRVKWLAFLSAGYVLYAALLGSWGTRAAIVAAFANYVLFFAKDIAGLVRDRNVRVRQAARRASMGEVRPTASDTRRTGGRACAICGKSEDDGADIRVCSCAKCGGAPRQLCLEHARNH